MMENLTEKIRYHKLYDIYSGLLTDKQKTYFEYNYLEDYSLSEISEIMGVSRNAVHDQVKNVLQHLDHYECVLKIDAKKSSRLEVIKELKENSKDEQVLALLQKLENE